jgi:putative exosortase-associated protein (TIGR04073 family)
MTKFNRFFVTLTISALFAVFTPISNAEEYSPQQSYGTKVGQKAARAFGNLGTAWLEIPKNMINVTNESNIFYGTIGGLFKGLVHMAGRLGVSVADLITIPLPTKPIAHPIYVWEDFDVDTTYGDTFRYDPSQKTQPQSAATLPAPRVAAPPAPPVDYSTQYEQNNNQKLDSMFKHKMMK